MEEIRTAKTTVKLSARLHRTLRVKAAVEERTINDIVVECVETCLGDFHLDPAMLEVETPPRRRRKERCAGT